MLGGHLPTRKRAGFLLDADEGHHVPQPGQPDQQAVNLEHTSL